jgi:catalase
VRSIVCIFSLVTNFMNTRRRGPSICIMPISSFWSRSCSYIHSWMWYAVNRGLLGSKYTRAYFSDHTLSSYTDPCTLVFVHFHCSYTHTYTQRTKTQSRQHCRLRATAHHHDT